jgi:hypothetical protein
MHRPITAMHLRAWLGVTAPFLAIACTDPTAPAQSPDGSAADTDRELPGAMGREGGPDASAGPLVSAPIGNGGGADAQAEISTTPAVEDGGLSGGAGPDGPLTQAQPEAGTPAADAAVGGGFPAWAQPLVGAYAKRAVMFNYDTAIARLTRSYEVSLVTADKDEAGGLWFTTKLCALVADWPQALDGLGTVMTIADPSKFPAVKQAITLGAEPAFTADPAARQLGFDPAGQARCKGLAPGSKADRAPEQVWITSGKCDCAANPALPPALSTDCRVTDTDADRQPGIRVSHTAGALAGSSLNMVFDSALSKIVGTVRANKRHELHENGMGTPGCFADLPEICSTGAPIHCGPPSVQLIPLTGEVSCDNAIASITKTLGAPSAVPEAACP